MVFVLDNLANLALKNFTPKKVIPPREEQHDQIDDIEDDSEVILDRVEEEMMALYSDESDEENILQISEIKRHEQNKEITSSNVDEEHWRLELERVLPQLKVTIKNDNQDWRAHLEQMRNLQNAMEQSFYGTKSQYTCKSQLEKMYKEITIALDKIGNREKYLNRNLESILEEYRILQDQLSKVKDTYKNISGGVTERNREYARLTDALDSIKQQMEERGSSMTDGSTCCFCFLKCFSMVFFFHFCLIMVCFSATGQYQEGYNKNKG